jgi:hypothetical protein
MRAKGISTIAAVAAAAAGCALAGPQPATAAPAQNICIFGDRITKYYSENWSNRDQPPKAIHDNQSYVKLTWRPQFCPGRGGDWVISREPVLEEIGAANPVDRAEPRGPASGVELDRLLRPGFASASRSAPATPPRARASPTAGKPATKSPARASARRSDPRGTDGRSSTTSEPRARSLNKLLCPPSRCGWIWLSVRI